MKYNLSIEFSSLEELQNFIKKDKQSSTISPPSVDPLRKFKRWTEFELQYLKDNYKNFKSREIAKSLCRPVTAVQQMVFAMNQKGANLKKINKAGKVKVERLPVLNQLT